MKHYLIRHNSGEYFVVSARTTARLRKLIEVECADRGWEYSDTLAIECHKRSDAMNKLIKNTPQACCGDELPLTIM